MFESLLMQATTTTTTGYESIVGITIAIAGIISAVSTMILKLHINPKIDAAAALGIANADKIVESKEDLTTLAKVTYELSPEEAKSIVNAENVRLVELEKKLQNAQQELKTLADRSKIKSPGATVTVATKKV